MGVKYISENIAILKEAGAIVTATRSVTDTAPPSDTGTTMSVKGQESKNIMQWGERNDLPNRREELVALNNIVPSLIATRRDITLGQGLYAYIERFEDGERIVEEVPMPEEAKAFFREVDIDDYLLTAAKNLLFHANVFTEFIRSNDGKRIVSMKAYDSRYIRMEEMDKHGRINAFYWYGYWPSNTKKRNTYNSLPVRIPTYMRDKPMAKSMYHTKDSLLCLDEYYATPYWWGSQNWIQLANTIPIFHINNLKHGYSIRYHIEIPTDYFKKNYTANQLTPDMRKDAEESEQKARQLFLNNLNDFLAGAENAGRGVVTNYEINKNLGKDFPGIKITPLTVDLKDEAMLKLFERSNQANISAQGVHPTLANIETAGRLSSGSEIRNAFLMYVAIKTPLPRQILLKPIKEVAMVNGWPEGIKYGFKDLAIKTLDESSNGIEEVMVDNAASI